MRDDRQGHNDVWNNDLDPETRSFLHMEMFGYSDEELKTRLTEEQFARYKAWLAEWKQGKAGDK